MKKLTGVLMSAMLLTISANANSEGFDQTKAYVGAGMGYNTLDDDGGFDFDPAIGFQFFGGYDFSEALSLANGVGLAAEVGFMNSGDFEPKDCGTFCNRFEADASGLWATAVGDYAINSQVKVLGRLGMDFGDDDGVIFGVGAGYNINEKMAVRAEYVIRDSINSLQGNFVYYLK